MEEENKFDDEYLMKEIINSLEDINFDLWEIPLDFFTKNEIIKSIPVLNIVSSVFHLGASIHNAIFMKKLYIFIINLPNASEEDKKKFLKKYKKDETKFSEKIFEILDKIDDSDKCKYESRIFEKYFYNKITYKEFLRYSYALPKIGIAELEEGYRTKMDNNIDEEGNIKMPNFTGLIFLSTGMANVIPVLGSCFYALNDDGKKFLECIFE